MLKARNDWKEKHNFYETFRKVTAILLVVSIVVLVALGASIQLQDLQNTYALAEETTDFLKAECQKYENYTRGITASSLQSLLDNATELKKFIPEENLSDSDFLKQYVHTVHLGGVLVLDQNLSLVAQADIDHLDADSLWQDVVCKEAVRNILRCPDKTYVDEVELHGTTYSFAVVGTEDGSKLILCYASTAKPVTDPYEINLSGILANNSFHKNPTVVITDGTQVLSTNDPVVAELGSTQYQQLSSSIQWKNDQLVRFRYGGTTFYGLRRVYGSYYLYAVYTSREMFTDRTNFIILAFMLYLLLCVHYLFAQRHIDKQNLNKMQKQLRIINAISTSYTSTFLLHIDRMELESIRASAQLQALFEQTPNPYDFLFHVCREYVAPEHRAILMDFLELHSMAQRLQGKPYLGSEIKDISGAWYSVMLIPQRFDEAGNVQAALITTQDVTAIKQAEELSFNDKLTGLHNRNYMESRAEHFVRAGDLPVSLIMADCNYLKRTNDTLGHECGDMLLQRVAKCIRQCAPEDSVVMRIGGDEFLALCPHCPPEEAQRTVAAMQQALEENSDEKLKLSVSFGVCTVEQPGPTFRDAYNQADRDMYNHKEHFHRENP